MEKKEQTYSSLDTVQLNKLSQDIRAKFEQKKLYKGASEVVTALKERKNLTHIYLVGPLDPWYKEGIVKSYKALEDSNIKLTWIEGKYKRLVYDSIKDVNLKPIKREKSRRFFLCRAFAL